MRLRIVYVLAIACSRYLQALRQYYNDVLNDKEREVISLKKGSTKAKDSHSLTEENSSLRVGEIVNYILNSISSFPSTFLSIMSFFDDTDLQRALEDERARYEVMESGYKAVKQYLEDGAGRRVSSDEVEKVGAPFFS